MEIKEKKNKKVSTDSFSRNLILVVERLDCQQNLTMFLLKKLSFSNKALIYHITTHPSWIFYALVKTSAANKYRLEFGGQSDLYIWWGTDYFSHSSITPIDPVPPTGHFSFLLIFCLKNWTKCSQKIRQMHRTLFIEANQKNIRSALVMCTCLTSGYLWELLRGNHCCFHIVWYTRFFQGTLAILLYSSLTGTFLISGKGTEVGVWKNLHFLFEMCCW